MLRATQNGSMTISANRVVALCERAAYFMREDLTLIESGHLKLQLFGADVTQEHADRMKARLSLLEEVIDGCSH
jgi:hypothetical protein